MVNACEISVTNERAQTVKENLKKKKKIEKNKKKISRKSQKNEVLSDTHDIN